MDPEEPKILDFGALQTRLRRKKPSKKLLEQAPVIFMAYDLLEFEGVDLRGRPWIERRSQMEVIFQSLSPSGFRLSPARELEGEDIDELRQEAASIRAEGLVIKRKDSPYSSGRVANGWYKYKLEPMRIDAVLIYATKGRGRRADQFTDYTFALWEGERLLPFAKAYSGLDAKEIAELDRFVKANLKERFGPVHSVEAVQVFELAFESVMLSPRHKSGLAVRFPRISRWRKDKSAAEANSLDDLRQLMSRAERG
jgi:DNA ligase-1